MGFDDILGGILKPVGDIVNNVINKTVTDKNDAQKATEAIQAAIVDAAVKGQLAQLDIDNTEAKSTNWFVAGWRPGAGWTCDIGLFMSIVFFPMLNWIAAVAGWHIPPAPVLPDIVYELLFGMLGLNTVARTVEKTFGVARS